MKNIVIFGSGVYAKLLFYEISKLKEFKVLGFIDKNRKKNTIIIKFKKKKFKILGKLKNLKKKNLYGIIAIGDNYKRFKIYSEVKKKFKNFNWAKIISKNSIINKPVKIEPGAVILSNVVVNSGSKIGSHCIINTSNSIDHDNIFEDFSSTGPRVVTGGNVQIGKFSFLGIGSIIIHKIRIKQNTVIGGNSFVNKNCFSNSIYFGSPAKKAKSRRLGDTYL